MPKSVARSAKRVNAQAATRQTTDRQGKTNKIINRMKTKAAKMVFHNLNRLFTMREKKNPIEIVHMPFFIIFIFTLLLFFFCSDLNDDDAIICIMYIQSTTTRQNHMCIHPVAYVQMYVTVQFHYVNW